jgi:hypothetical protein
VEVHDFRLRREVAENCTLLRCYAASSGNLLPTFRDNLAVPSSGVNKFSDSRTLKLEPRGCPETSVRNNHNWG